MGGTLGSIRPRGLSNPPSVEDEGLQSWFQEVKDALDGLPFSTFSTSDGPNESAFTSPEGFIGIEIGSSVTKFWFKESGSTSTGWVPRVDGLVDFNLRVPGGAVSGISGVNVFGENTDIDTGTDPEDVWEIGGVLDISLISTPSKFTLVSSSASDDGSGSGATYTGARVVQVLGLKTWDITESTETVEMAGTVGVETVESYVFINRLTVISSGDLYHNIGILDAIPAHASGASQSRIGATKGESHSAFCAFSSLDDLYIADWYGDLDKSGAAATTLFDLRFMSNPDTADNTWITKADLGTDSDANSNFEHNFIPYLKLSGPGLAKIEAEETTANNTAVSAGFDAFLVKKTTIL